MSQTDSRTHVAALRSSPPCRRPARRVFAVAFPLALLLAAPSAHAYEVASLPADNLVKNPWFADLSSGSPEPDASGWVFEGAPTWGTGNDKDDCPGPSPHISMPTLRWARQASATPQFHPNVEVRAHTIVSADASKRTLRFFMHWVMHRMTLEAHVYAGASSAGPWTEVWVPFSHTETVEFQPPKTAPRSDTWKHFMVMPAKFDDWYAPKAVSKQLGLGYGFYKIELRASYPDPSNTATGGVGGKLTGVYFSVGDDGTPPAPPPPASGADGGVTDPPRHEDGGSAGGDPGGTRRGVSPSNPGDEGGLAGADARADLADSGGCAVSSTRPGPSGGAVWALGLVGLALVRTRMRRKLRP